MIKKSALGFTIFELLVVIALIGLLSLPLLTGGGFIGGAARIRANSDQVYSDMVLARSYARDARDRVNWGVRYAGQNSYEIVSGNEESITVFATRSLDSSVSFEDEFTVWFTSGVGETTDDHELFLVDRDGKKIRIMVYKSGLIEKFEI